MRAAGLRGGRVAVPVLLAALPILRAQQITPHIGYVYPAGGQQGGTFEVTVGGQFLDGIREAIISGSGIEATIVKFVKPLTQGQFNKLREQFQQLQQKRAEAAKRQRRAASDQPRPEWTPADEKTLVELREKLGTFIRRPSSPAIAEQVVLRIAMAPDAAIGERELRLETSLGLTNPLMFCVGQLPEFSKPPAKPQSDIPPAKKVARFRAPVPKPADSGPLKVTVPTVINGQILAGTIDRFQFPARKGQRLVIAAAARELIPYISDAVPGWFQATLALYDANGKEVAYDDDYRFHPDPVLYYEIPADGEYTLAIKDSIYRGREDFVYRISVSEAPFLTSIFPLGAKSGSRVNIEPRGWNLPAARLTENLKGKGPGIYPVTVRKGEWISNPMPFAVDTLPERNEHESNNTIKAAQSVKPPIVINGRIDRAGDEDVFRFQGRAGEEIVAEVLARRLESPLDSVLRLTDAGGRQLAVNDDFEDKAAGLLTHQADSHLRFKLPAKGNYYLHLADTQRKGGPEYGYRLRISRPRPDFELRVAPASISARAGANVPITVYALRRDGFTGEIALRLKDAARGFLLSGAWVPAGQDQVRLTLTAPQIRGGEPVKLHLEGRARIEGKEVARLATPAENMMQAFAYHHLVPAHDWLARVTGAARGRAQWKLASDKPVKLPAGGSAAAKLTMPLGRFAGQVHLALNEPPEGVAIQRVTASRDGVSILLQTDAAKVKPGLKGNLIVEAYMERQGTPTGKKTALRRQTLGMLPAIPFEIVRP